jgi:divinyl chlorophyllide a 8-vinyl-reductase
MMNSTMALLIAVLLCVLSVQGFAPLSSSNSRLLFIERYATSSSTIPFYAKEVSSATSSGSSSTKDKAVVVAGGTGYIGKAVVAESVKLGYKTFVLVRNVTKLSTPEGQYAYGDLFNGATVVECNVEDPSSLKTVFESIDVPVDAVVSCLASPSGTKKSAYAIDYQATLNCLEAGQNCDARHFVMLSAFCCRRPLLQLQQAKLAFEAELAKQDKMTWSVVRPTAFFKSISGQLEAIKSGAPYVLFDDGAVTQCNAIAECELAEFMLDSLVNEEKKNKIMNVGGPDEPLTNKMLGEVSSFRRGCWFVYCV